MLRRFDADVLERESTQTLEKANNLIATLRISTAYLVFCAIMSFLSTALVICAIAKLAKHGISGLKMHADLSEEMLELALCVGILFEVLFALRLMPLQILIRVKLLQVDICVFLVSSFSAAFTSGSLARFAGLSANYLVLDGNAASAEESKSEEYLRGAAAALFLFRFLLQPMRAFLAMRNAWQLSRERRVAMEDIVLPEMPSCNTCSSPVSQQIGGFHLVCSADDFEARNV